MKYLSSYVQKPTTAPAPQTATAGSVQVAHRRKNLAGGYSEAAIVGATSLPNTFVYQGYNDSANLDSDEILVKPAPGPWYKVPTANLNNLIATIPNPVPVAWDTVTDAELSDSQTQFTISNLDFGSFSSASEPSQTFYLLNDGVDTINSLDFAVNATDGAALNTLDERVRVDYEGVLGSIGVGNYDTAANGSLTYALGGRNGYSITLGPRGVAKITLNLVNFPASGLDSISIGAEFVFNPNRSGFSLPTFLEWEDGAILISENSPVTPVSDDPNSLGILVSPITARVGNLVYQSSVEQVITPSSVTTGVIDCILYLTQTGVIGASEVGQTIPTGSVELGSFTYNTSSGAVEDWKLAKAPQNPSYYIEPDSLLTVGRGVEINSSGFLAHGEDAIGVAVNTLGKFVYFGWAQCEVGSTVTKGQTLAPNSIGVYNPSSTGRAVAQEPGETGDLVTCFLLNPATISGGGVTPGSETDLTLARTSTAVVVESSTGSNAVIPAASVTLAGVMTAADKAKLDGIPTGGSSGSTDLTLARTSTTVAVESSTGTNATIPAATVTLAGVLSSADKSKLDGIGAGATLSNLGFSRTGTTLTLTNSGGTGVVLPSASTAEAGLMSAADKTKLNGIPAGGSSGGGGLTAVDLSLSIGSATIEIENSGGANVVLPSATPSAAGLMSGPDKNKLNGIPNGGGLSQVNLSTSAIADQVTITNSAGGNAVIPAATTSTAGVLTGTDKTRLDALHAASPNNLTAVNLGATAQAANVLVTNSGGTNATIPAVTGTLAGVMTPADKTKLDGLSTGGGSGAIQDLSLSRETNGNITVNISDGGDSATIPLASTSLSGLMSGPDKSKLNGLGIVSITRSVDNPNDRITLSLFNGSGTVNLDPPNSLSPGLFTFSEKNKLAGLENRTISRSNDASSITIALSNGGGSIDLNRPTSSVPGLFTWDERQKLDGLPTSIPTPPPTNLSTITSSTVLLVTSSTGNDTPLPFATTNSPGIMSSGQFNNLSSLVPVTVDLVAGDFRNGWGNFNNGYQGARVTRIGKIVVVSGLLASGTATAGQAIPMCVLPVGFRPALAHMFMCFCSGGASRVDVLSDGTVRLGGESVGFASPSAYQSISVSFPVP